jgi:hypothetical protein
MYNASGRGIDFNKERTDEEEDERMQKLANALQKNARIDYRPMGAYSRIRDEVDVEKLKKQYPNDSSIAYTDISFGADIEAEQVFQQELHGIVDEMKVKLVDEKKILEGTLNPEYGKGEWGLPHIEKVEGDIFQEANWVYSGPQDMEYGKGEWKLPEFPCCKLDLSTYDFNRKNELPHMRTDKPPSYEEMDRQRKAADENHMKEFSEGKWPEFPYGKRDLSTYDFNRKNELSNSNPVEEQWKSDSQNGSLTTDLTPTSTNDSSSSSSIAEDSIPNFPTVSLRRQSTNSPNSSCSEKSDDSGTETDATNESFECTVPTISAAMHGMLNEARWSPPPRSTESLAPNLLAVRS